MVSIEGKDKERIESLLVESKQLPLLPGIPRYDSLIPSEILKVSGLCALPKLYLNSFNVDPITVA